MSKTTAAPISALHESIKKGQGSTAASDYIEQKQGKEPAQRSRPATRQPSRKIEQHNTKFREALAWYLEQKILPLSFKEVALRAGVSYSTLQMAEFKPLKKEYQELIEQLKAMPEAKPAPKALVPDQANYIAWEKSKAVRELATVNGRLEDLKQRAEMLTRYLVTLNDMEELQSKLGS